MRPEQRPAVARLTAQLRRLGVGPRTGVLLVHAALRSLAPAAGDSAQVLAALRAALGPGGTLVAYTATPENSLTSRLHVQATAGLTPAERAAHLAAMPPFDPRRTPCSPTVGRLSEELRRAEGARRSAHPQTSFAALGPRAAELTAEHPYECHLGEASPVGALYRAGAQVLMLGAPLTACTVLHLAEYRVPAPPRKRYGCVVRAADGAARWVHFDGVDLDDAHFPRMLARISPGLGPLATGLVGGAEAVLLPVRPAVDAARAWLLAELTGRTGAGPGAGHGSGAGSGSGSGSGGEIVAKA
ncbi:AAC(3) family N-acetyltransferase [Kitasatospora sp. NBC_01287]|uniref:aminoglycoside N(3)-acetyltransferase n=1 Tax=Kitasatospora sp. NBC_01287 TaxID=2903573 RepID=UPI002259962E|nr:AAC(3) family N-acetyltransferase [Kitasatospora sp. NBC_01287]MCX4747290.1 AAC(3) family N-acetyltransferase [Kitasatospora sp. NBC_01287]